MMKYSFLLRVVFVLWQAFFIVSARPSDLTISKDMPDPLLETIGQAINCSHSIDFAREKLSPGLADGLFPEDNESFNEYFGCIWMKKGIINENAEINEDNLRRHLEELFTMGGPISDKQKLLVSKVMEQCKDVEDSDYKKKSVKVNNCVISFLYTIINE